MRVLIISFVLSAVMCITFTSTTQAQTKRSSKKTTEQYFDESKGLKHKLWYGGGFNLGFQNNVFQIGISPMVGYKIFEQLSVGPRVEINYTYRKFDNVCPQIFNKNTTDFSVGAFTRYKFLKQFFAHVEYNLEFFENLDPDNDGFISVDCASEDVISANEQKSNLFIGAGYNSGGLIAYEIALLYNLLEPEDSIEIPFSLRIGITYQF